MKTKHTQGEWCISDVAKHHQKTLIFSKSDLRLVADVTSIRSNEEEEANAKLIAAAPDLLEALNDFYGLICEGHVKVYSEEEINVQKYYNQIESAIKKATS